MLKSRIRMTVTISSVLFLSFLILSPLALGCVQTTISSTTVTMIGHYTNTTCCGLLCWFTCYANQSRILYSTQYIISYKCCGGYGPGYPDCNPICNDTCAENYVCSAPDTCTCAPGWTGSDCETDIDECTEGIDECEDKCINIPGLYLCSCSSNSHNILAPSNEHRCLSPVRNVQSIAGLNRTLDLTWNHPEGYTEDGNFTGFYITCTSKTHEAVYTIGNTTSWTAHSLIPYTNYTCCITPEWTNDRGPATCINSTTLQDAPEDSPLNLIVKPVSVDTLLIQWTPPLTPNGIITYYTLYINYTNSTTASLSIKTEPGYFNTIHIEGLFPYQLVGISISATTLGGEGPSTDFIFNRTYQSEPLEVTDLYVTIILNSTIKVTWSPPITPNGIITNYRVIITSITNDNQHLFKKEKIVSSTIGPLLAYFTDLEPFVPYSAQVSGVTTAGVGQPSEYIFFTLESVPRISPVIISASRSTPTSIDFSWAEMSLEDSRGFLTEYNLFIIPSIIGCTVILEDERVAENTTEDETSFLFTGLEPASNYCISIVAYTEMGKGIESSLQFVQTYEKSFVVVYFSGIHECSLWRQTDTQSKLNRLDEIMLHLLLSNCSCPLSEDYILESHFGLCYNNSILVYQAYILGTVQVNSSQLVDIIKHWGNSKPAVVVQGVQLIALAACDGTDQCTILDTTEETPSNELGIIILVGFGGLILGLAVCIVLAFIAVTTLKVYTSRRRRQNGRIYRPQDTQDTSDTEMAAMERFSKLQKETEI